jgi:hypothetical protein
LSLLTREEVYILSFTSRNIHARTDCAKDQISMVRYAITQNNANLMKFAIYSSHEIDYKEALYIAQWRESYDVIDELIANIGGFIDGYYVYIYSPTFVLAKLAKIMRWSSQILQKAIFAEIAAVIDEFWYLIDELMERVVKSYTNTKMGRSEYSSMKKSEYIQIIIYIKKRKPNLLANLLSRMNITYFNDTYLEIIAGN